MSIRGTTPYERWCETNVVRGAAKGTVSAMASIRLGDVTVEQFRGLASILRELGVEARTTPRQNLAFRGLTEAQLPTLFARLDAMGMAQPGAELARDVVACPGADTCNLAVTQSRGLADAIGDALEEAGLAEVGGVRTNISGCTNSCGQHHATDIGFFGAERRAHGKAAPGLPDAPRRLRRARRKMHFGEKALRLPGQERPRRDRAGRRPGSPASATAGETFRSWLDRSGGAKAVAADLKDLDQFPTPEEAPDFYVDFGETGPVRRRDRRVGVRHLTGRTPHRIRPTCRRNQTGRMR